MMKIKRNCYIEQNIRRLKFAKVILRENELSTMLCIMHPSLSMRYLVEGRIGH